MALKVTDEINLRLKCLYRKNKFLTPALRRLLWNALSPYFDYALSFWYPNLTQKMKNNPNHAKYIHSALSAARQNDPYF